MLTMRCFVVNRIWKATRRVKKTNRCLGESSGKKKKKEMILALEKEGRWKGVAWVRLT